MKRNLVSLSNFQNTAEAEMAKSFLAAYCIETFLFDKHMGGLVWHANITTSGTRLMVRECDYQQAHDLLKSVDSKKE